MIRTAYLCRNGICEAAVPLEWLSPRIEIVHPTFPPVAHLYRLAFMDLECRECIYEWYSASVVPAPLPADFNSLRRFFEGLS
jgi:hypothetical protein